MFKPIKGYENSYLVNELGAIFSLNINKELKQCSNNGYRMVSLSKDNKLKTKYIHRAVAEAFIPNPENKPCINHKNHDTSDNRFQNLEWCTYTENMRFQRKCKFKKTSKYKGVSLFKTKSSKSSRWAAQIWVNKENKRLGFFKTEEDAATAYNMAAYLYFGKFAYLNK